MSIKRAGYRPLTYRWVTSTTADGGTSSAVATAPFLAALGTIKGAAVAELVKPASYLGKLYSTTDRQYRPKV